MAATHVQHWEMNNMNNKKRGACVELTLGEMNLKKVPEGIDLYPCLEVLYLNNNPIRKVVGLMHNFRIRFLDMSFCKLTTLVGSDICALKNLQTLILRGNDIADIKAQTRVLQGLPCMDRLEVADNPMAYEQDATQYLIALLPKLAVLDCHSVEPVAREVANQKCRALNWVVQEADADSPQKGKKKKKGQPLTLAFNKRCTYRRRPISRSTRMAPTKCEKDAEKFSHAAKGKVIRDRLRWERDFNEAGRHSAPPLNYADFDCEVVPITKTRNQITFGRHMAAANQAIKAGGAAVKPPKVAGDHLKFMRWSELDNSARLSPAPEGPSEYPIIGSRVASSLGLHRQPSTQSRAITPMPDNTVVTISLPKIGSKYANELQSRTYEAIRPITPLFTTYNHGTVLKQFNFKSEPLPCEAMRVQPTCS